ncbi:MAG TPA: RsiV family protein [Paenalcaligenes sp.]|nr:RsiV family protein [Paenalcaligenes sp.]
MLFMLQKPSVRVSATLLFTVILSACASSGSGISKIPSQTGDITQADGTFTQPLKQEKIKANCKGTCPKLSIDSLVFPGNPKLTQHVDAVLASMAGMDEEPTSFRSIAEFEKHYWETAGPRDQVILATKPRYRNKDLTVLELGVWQYFTGAAHGMSATQFLNWDNRQANVLTIDDILLPGKKTAFNQALQQAHESWLRSQEDAQDDPEQYRRLWPFQPTDNIALTDTGVVAKYDAYAIAPYSSGQPELHIAYPQLQGILKPSYLPR